MKAVVMIEPVARATAVSKIKFFLFFQSHLVVSLMAFFEKEIQIRRDGAFPTMKNIVMVLVLASLQRTCATKYPDPAYCFSFSVQYCSL